MLPSFERYLQRYLLLQLMGLSLICLLLTFALIRNVAGQGQGAVLLAVGVIVWGVSFAALRDLPGYWVYAALAPKFVVDARAREVLGALRVNRWIQAMNPLQHPMIAPSLLAALMTLLLWGLMSLLPKQQGVALILVPGLLFPLWLALQAKGAARYFLLLASPEGERLMQQDGAPQRRSLNYRLEDLLVSLSITFVLIWPLGNNPAFSRDAGYLDGDFLVAALLLCWIAGFFVVLGARRSRLYSMTGEQLSALFRCEMPQVPAALRSLSFARRSALYLLLSGGWVLLICALLSWFTAAVPFAFFCLLLLPALGSVFWMERGLRLRADFTQAAQFISERAVAPVAVPRRSLDGG